MDTANLVAMYAGNRCGPVGHLFPFDTPFAKISCNGLLVNVTQYKNWECTEQEKDTFSYRWGQCIELPFLSKGVKKYVRLY